MENRGNWLIYGATGYTSELAADKRLQAACFLEYVGSEWGVYSAYTLVTYRGREKVLFVVSILWAK